MGATHTTVVFVQDLEITENDLGIGQTYTGTHDAELRQDNPDSNYNEGAGSTDPNDKEFKVDAVAIESHVVMRFDDVFDHVPTNATIIDATLFIDIDNTGDDMSLYRLAEGISAWTETTVTWNSLGSGTNGVDIGTDTTGSATIIAGDGNKVYIDVSADVVAWHQGATNNGWAFLPGGSDGVDFDASENSADSADRPSLTVEYVVINTNAVVFSQDTIVGSTATATLPYAESIAAYAADPDSDPLTFEKVDGPLWLHVATNGALSGTPTPADMGANLFTVQVADTDDGSAVATLSILVNDQHGNPPPAPSDTEHYRITWDNDPGSTTTIAWKQLSSDTGTVFYGTTDFGRDYTNYPNQKSVDKVGNYTNAGVINSCFARLTGLQPDTAYYFVIKDDAGVSPRFWFLTAPDTPTPFTFVGGGDSRSNPIPRRRANRMVSKLRPLFIIFTGDMIDNNNAVEWNEWFGDWQETICPDGRIIPLIPHRGNHEGYGASGNSYFFELFDTTAENYYSFSVGGSLLRFYVLNSEMDSDAVKWNAQTSWLTNDLSVNAAFHTHLAAGYHKPMRPHRASKSEGNNEYDAWAQPFYDHGMDLVFEADSHTVKRTWPVRPDSGVGSDEGFIRDDANGTVYTGEGCWGAPLRSPDDPKDWTRDTGMFNSFDWVHVYPLHMELYTIQVDTVDSVGDLLEGDSFSLPSGIDVWAPTSGTRVIVNQLAGASTNSYAQWQIDQWGVGAIPPNAEAWGDFDGDGYNNMTEFAYGLDPEVAAVAGSGVLPVVLVDSSDIGISYRRKANAALTYHYDFSSNLIAWVSMVEGVDYSQSVTPAGGNEQVTLDLLGPKESVTNGFIRVKIGIQ